MLANRTYSKRTYRHANVNRADAGHYCCWVKLLSPPAEFVCVLLDYASTNKLAWNRGLCFTLFCLSSQTRYVARFVHHTVRNTSEITCFGVAVFQFPVNYG